MSEWVAEWSGSYPNLCRGEWTLYHNEEEVDVSIPFQGHPADTYGKYWKWFFGGASGWKKWKNRMKMVLTKPIGYKRILSI